MLNIGYKTGSTQQQDNALVWDLNSFHQRNLAHEFVLYFENKICVYSDTVEQVYTNYNIYFPHEENRRLVILPNPEASHDVFNGVPEKAIKPTGLYIVPKVSDDTSSMMLRIPLKYRQQPFRDIPIQVGLRLVNDRRPKHLPLLPILMKGDLREFDEKTPILHLHALCLSALDTLSSLEVNNIRKVILERLETL